MKNIQNRLSLSPATTKVLPYQYFKDLSINNNGKTLLSTNKQENLFLPLKNNNKKCLKKIDQFWDNLEKKVVKSTTAKKQQKLGEKTVLFFVEQPRNKLKEKFQKQSQHQLKPQQEKEQQNDINKSTTVQINKNNNIPNKPEKIMHLKNKIEIFKNNPKENKTIATFNLINNNNFKNVSYIFV